MAYTIFANSDVMGFVYIIGAVVVIGISIRGIAFSISNKNKKKDH